MKRIYGQAFVTGKKDDDKRLDCFTSSQLMISLEYDMIFLTIQNLWVFNETTQVCVRSETCVHKAAFSSLKHYSMSLGCQCELYLS